MLKDKRIEVKQSLSQYTCIMGEIGTDTDILKKKIYSVYYHLSFKELLLKENASME